MLNLMCYQCSHRSDINYNSIVWPYICFHPTINKRLDYSSKTQLLFKHIFLLFLMIYFDLQDSSISWTVVVCYYNPSPLKDESLLKGLLHCKTKYMFFFLLLFLKVFFSPLFCQWLNSLMKHVPHLCLFWQRYNIWRFVSCAKCCN